MSAPHVLKSTCALIGAIAIYTDVARLRAQAPEPLFVELSSPSISEQAAADLRPYVVRSRTVGLRSAPLDRALESPRINSFTLNLFDDVALAVAFERVEESGLGHRTWIGHVADRPLSTVILTRKADVVMGAVADGATRFEIAALGGGLHRIDQLDTAAMPRTRDAVLPVPESAAPFDEPQVSHEHGRGVVAAPRDRSIPAATPGADILVYYSPGVRAQAGGTAQAQALVAQFVAESNTAYARSGVNGLVRLLAALEVPVGDGADPEALLPALATHPLPRSHRNLGGVDMVALLLTHLATPIPNWIACGLAYVGPASEFAFSVTATRSECRAVYAFTHEIGHNLGAQHAPDDAVINGPPYPAYARGYKAPDQTFRTVMAYECPTGPQCPAILHFSNPAVLAPPGQPTGTPSQDNVRRANELFAAVAHYRPSRVPPSPPSSLQGSANGSTVTVAWLPPASGGAPSGYLIDAGTAPGQSNLISGLPIGETNVTASGVPPGRYFLRVRARNGAGVSGFSNEVAITVP